MEKQGWIQQNQDLELSLRNKENELELLEEKVTSTKNKLHSLHNEYRHVEVQRSELIVLVEKLKCVHYMHNYVLHILLM